jgi:2-oxoglutarate ferredoxin oxidoreductase subunit delta
MAKVEIKVDVCKGCGLCTVVCPKKIMVLSKDKINDKGYSPVEVTDMTLCIGCASCAKMCPDAVISVYK